MQPNNLTIYTLEQKNGKIINQFQNVSKIHHRTPLYIKSKPSYTFIQTDYKNNPSLTTTSKSFHSKKIKTKKPLSKSKEKITCQTESNFNPLTMDNNFYKTFNPSQTTIARNKSFSSTKMKKHSSISSLISTTKQNKVSSTEIIQDSIGEIIKLKNEYSELKDKPAELDKQKQDIIEYFQNKMNELNQVRMYYLTQKNNFTLHQDQNNQMLSIIKSKSSQLTQMLTQKENTINNLNEQYTIEKENIDKDYEHKQQTIQNYFENRFKNYILFDIDNNNNSEENNFDKNLELNEEDRENVSALMRAMFSIMEMSIEGVEDILFKNDNNDYKNDDIVEIICDKIWVMIKPYCGFMKSKEVLYGYLKYLYNKVLEEKEESVSFEKGNDVENEDNNYNEIEDNKPNNNEPPTQIQPPIEVTSNVPVSEDRNSEEPEQPDDLIEENEIQSINLIPQGINGLSNNNNIINQEDDEDEEEPIQDNIPQEYKIDDPIYTHKSTSEQFSEHIYHNNINNTSEQSGLQFPLQQNNIENNFIQNELIQKEEQNSQDNNIIKKEESHLSANNNSSFSYINKIYLFQQKFLSTIGTIPYYPKSTIEGYNSILKKLFIPHKTSLISFIDQQSTQTQPNIISLSIFNEFITTNKALTSFFLENPTLYQFLLFYLKYSSEQNLNLLDLNFNTLIKVIDNDCQSLLDLDYINKIEEYLKNEPISFDEFIYPLSNHVIEKEGICYVNIKIFELLLKVNGIISMNKQLNINDSHYINLTELSAYFASKN